MCRHTPIGIDLSVCQREVNGEIIACFRKIQRNIKTHKYLLQGVVPYLRYRVFHIWPGVPSVPGLITLNNKQITSNVNVSK